MGAKGSTGGGGDDNAQPPVAAMVPGTRRLALLSGTQGAALEAELKQLGVAEARGDAAAPPSGKWLVFYDNDDCALTLRGWWLCERDGEWLLRVPTFGPAESKCGLCVKGYEEITEPDQILEKAGLVQHADAYRKGVAKSVERLLQRAGVCPFARLHSECCTYRLTYEAGDLAAGGADAKGNALTLSLTRLRLDPLCAEDQAVADLLFERGAGAREAMRATVVDIELSAGLEGEAAARPPADELAKCLRKHGCERALSTRVAFPEAVAYIAAFRPLHAQKLRRAGVPLDA